jgi:hypothetical protein
MGRIYKTALGVCAWMSKSGDQLSAFAYEAGDMVLEFQASGPYPSPQPKDVSESELGKGRNVSLFHRRRG